MELVQNIYLVFMSIIDIDHEYIIKIRQDINNDNDNNYDNNEDKNDNNNNNHNHDNNR